MNNIQTELPENNLEDLEIPKLTSEQLSRAVPFRKVLEAKKSTTIRLKTSTIMYFQLMSKDTGIPYQTLINMYLDDCANNNRRIKISFE